MSPQNQRTDGCFVYLAHHAAKYAKSLERSLRLLKKNYLDRHPTPVVVFHEAKLTEARRAAIVRASGVHPQFVELTFTIPDHIDQEKLCSTRVGYLHMCQFFADGVFHHPALERYTYHCRLDSDSFILSPVNLDIFHYAAAHRVKYGFIDNAIRDNKKFTVGLPAVLEEHIQAHPELASQRGSIEVGRVYYTNFELCHRGWFQGEAWSEFFSRVNARGGIYYHRWGDHTIRYMGVNLLMSPSSVYRFTGIHYRHVYEFNKHMRR